MEVELFRTDYTQVGTTAPKTTKLLSKSQNIGVQKIVVGDQDGVVHVFTLLNCQLQTVFKTLPAKPVSSVQLGGALNSVKDSIFVAAGDSVSGYTRHGKQFLSLQTNLTDRIENICVSGNDLLICSQFAFSHFNNCKEIYHQMLGEDIRDVICLPVEKVDVLVSVLACKDRCLRVVRSNGVRYTIETDGVVECLELLLNTGGSSGDWLVYGTNNGTLASLKIGRDSAEKGWCLTGEDLSSYHSESADGVSGGVVCIHHGELTAHHHEQQSKQMVVGRDNGVVQLFEFSDDVTRAAPTLCAMFTAGESISSVQIGFVSSPESPEILVTTYSGRVFGLTANSDPATLSSANVATLSNDAKRRIMKLRSELEELQRTVDREREKCKRSKGEITSSVVPEMAVNNKFTLNSEDSSYRLAVEIASPIDNILLQSDVPVDLMDVEKNSSVSSVYIDKQTSDGNYLLATYRCQANTNRLELCLRTIEGQYGTLRVYVTPRAEPRTAHLSRHTVAPLSLHIRTHKFDHQRPHSTLVLSGDFSMSEVHSWLRLCLADVSERCPSTETASAVFKSTFLGTQLLVTYSRGRVEFKSDNISTISIVKEVLTREATKKNIALNINCDVSSESTVNTLQLLRPRLCQQYQLNRQLELLEPLQELCEHERDSDGSFLCQEYRSILARADEIRAESSRHPALLERLYGMITDLYIDKYKFLGVSVKSRVSQLLEILYTNNFDALVEFFDAAPMF